MMRQSAWKPRWVSARSVAATVAIGTYSCSVAHGGYATSCGRTPTTVNTPAVSDSVLPRMAGSPPNRACQRSYERTVTCAPDCSSSCVKSRPTSGGSPSVAKKPGETNDAGRRCTPSGPQRAHRIDLRGPTGGNEAPHQGHHPEQRGPRDERPRVVDAHPEQHVAQKPDGSERAAKAD